MKYENGLLDVMCQSTHVFRLSTRKIPSIEKGIVFFIFEYELTARNGATLLNALPHEADRARMRATAEVRSILVVFYF